MLHPIIRVILLACLLVIPAAPVAAAAKDCTFPDITYASRLSAADQCGGRLRAGAVDGVIEKHGFCRFLDNASANDYFVPANTLIELLSFYGFAPQGVAIDLCIRPYSRTDTVDTHCGIDAGEPNYADVLADNPTGCLLSGNMTSVTHSALLTRWTSRAKMLAALSQDPPQDSITTLLREDADNNSLIDRSVYTFPMQRKDCRTARTGERVCNYRQFSQNYIYDYSVPPLPASELGFLIALSLSNSHDAPEFEAPGPLNCPPTYSHGEYYDIDGGTRYRVPTAAECPWGAGTRQFEQQVWNRYHCNDGVGDVTGSVRYEDTGNYIGVCTPQPCNLPWGGQIASGQSVTAYYEYSPGCGSACYAETRTCNAGVLSGSYGAATCAVQACANCGLPWGGAIAHGQSTLAYAASSVGCGSSCSAEWRTCNNGQLSGSYGAASCSVAQCSHHWVQISWSYSSGLRPCNYLTEQPGMICNSPGERCYPILGMGGPLGIVECQ